MNYANQDPFAALSGNDPDETRLSRVVDQQLECLTAQLHPWMKQLVRVVHSVDWMRRDMATLLGIHDGTRSMTDTEAGASSETHISYQMQRDFDASREADDVVLHLEVRFSGINHRHVKD